ncbi:MAG: DUF971 domain-containing protein [Rhodothermaceae bacterium]
MVPVKIKIEDEALKIYWDNNSESKIKLVNLRDNCPCAFCKKEQDERDENYIPLYIGDQITIDKIIPVGNYAIKIIWKDGHSTGMYDFEYLRKFKD